MNSKPSSTSLESRLALTFALVSLLITASIAVASYFNLRAILIEDVRQRLQTAASLAILTIDGDLHAGLTQPDQENSADYRKLQAQLQTVRGTDDEFMFVYTMRSVGETVIFVVDAETNPDLHSSLGSVYSDIDPLIKQQIGRLTSTLVDQEFYSDQWGVFLSAYAPIYTSEGQLDAVLGIDISYESVAARQNSALLYALVAGLIAVAVATVLGYFLGLRLAAPLKSLIAGASLLAGGDLSHRIQPRGWSEVQQLAQAFNQMAEQLSETVQELENRILERTRQSEQRSAYLTAAAEVAASAAAFLDPARLTAQVVELIQQRFDLYYVGLFLLDESGEMAVLRAGTGAAGQAMLERSHRIHTGEGMIGWAITNAQPRIALEAGADAQRLVNPLLPETRSEAAIPLRSRNRVLGALTIQSTQANAFDQSILSTLQTMADQIALALDNARLLAESQSSLEAMQRSYQQLTQAAWSDFLRRRGALGYRADAAGLSHLQALPPLPAGGGGDQDEGLLSLPVSVRGQTLGRLQATKAGSWSAAEIELLRSLLEQFSSALDNARLYSATQRSAERERLLAEITGRLRSSTNVEAILQTAVQELAHALNAPRGSIRLATVHSEPAAPPAGAQAAAGTPGETPLQEKTL